MGCWGTYSKFNHSIVEAYKNISKGNRFILLDGGAAGNISEPFDMASSVLEAIRFEPRGGKEVKT
jgi:hypothetical protein